MNDLLGFDVCSQMWKEFPSALGKLRRTGLGTRNCRGGAEDWVEELEEAEEGAEHKEEDRLADQQA